MKLFKMVFIFLIGMISFTALATTPMLDQKPKPTIEMFVNQTTIVAAVVTFESVSFEAQSFRELSDYNIYRIVNSDFNVVKNEVSFGNSMQFYVRCKYVERLTTDYQIDHRKRLQSIGLNYSLRYNC